MKLEIKIIGTLTRPSGKDAFSHELPGGTPIREILADLGYEPRHIPHIMVSVNGELRHRDFSPSDGDTLVLSVTVGGG